MQKEMMLAASIESPSEERSDAALEQELKLALKS